jgi:hypothetical protein
MNILAKKKIKIKAAKKIQKEIINVVNFDDNGWLFHELMSEVDNESIRPESVGVESEDSNIKK